MPSAKGAFVDMDLREHARLARMFAADHQQKEEERVALWDTDGTRRMMRPTTAVQARRLQQANGRPEADCTDTIGKLAAWDLLNGGRFPADLLRDAGRRYAAAYWFRYGNVCGHIGAYTDMVRKSRAAPTTLIVDPEADAVAEFRFNRRDEALRALGERNRFKHLVDQVCVDGAGDNDPGWLIDLMAGYPAETRELRAKWAQRQLALGIGSKDQKRRAKRLEDDTRRQVQNELRQLRRERLPHADLRKIRMGLDELAAIDAGEGLHRPKAKDAGV